MNITDRTAFIPYMGLYVPGVTETLYRRTLRSFPVKPLSGKTRTLCSVAADAIKSGYNVAYVSLDTTMNGILHNIAGVIYDTPSPTMEQVEHMRATYKSQKLIVHQVPAHTKLSEIAELLRLNGNIDLLVVDYINLVAPNDDSLTFKTIEDIERAFLPMLNTYSATCVTAEVVPAWLDPNKI